MRRVRKRLGVGRCWARSGREGERSFNGDGGEKSARLDFDFGQARGAKAALADPCLVSEKTIAGRTSNM